MPLATLFFNALKIVLIFKIIFLIPKINLNTYLLCISEKIVLMLSFIHVLTYTEKILTFSAELKMFLKI